MHIADTHLGANPHQDNTWQIDRAKELWEAVERVVRFAEKEKADLLLIAGDMFHRQPLMRELKELNYIFSQLTHTQVVFIAGNHDHVKASSYYKTFEWEKHVHFLASPTGESIYFEELNTEVYGLSYDHYEIKENRCNDIVIRDKSRINILLAHGGDEKHIPFSKAELSAKGFDYVALGHIHVPQVLIPGKIAYAGSLEPVDMGDEGVHGFFLADLSKEGCELKFIKCAKREYRTLEIECDSSFTNRKLLNVIQEDMEKTNAPADFWKLVLTGFRDEDISFDKEDIYALNRVVSVVDDTKPDYDFDKLAQEYEKNIIGRYIQNIRSDDMTDTKRRALYFGVKALLDEMG
ncbi:metallophosphoesterase family protein [Konateibacter massiliensis]|uniref:metallophosphoesterase family protein n=1 Tax=Konateibacter massiliensis TaxID=2002841 RepID=UPI001F242046|nr:DNA repair exonuclease [Konateibacter massiliensis]